MILFIAVFGAALLGAGIYVAYDERKVRTEKLNKIQRELARREAAEKSQQIAETQD